MPPELTSLGKILSQFWFATVISEKVISYSLLSLQIRPFIPLICQWLLNCRICAHGTFVVDC